MKKIIHEINFEDLIEYVFNTLLNSKSVEDVDKIPDQAGIPEKYFMNLSKYPPGTFGIQKKDIIELKRKGFIDDNNQLNDLSQSDVFAKLLYSLIWKNGDLQKISHIIEGIMGDDKDVKEKGIVFYQFGRHLANSCEEPIVDQHVIRAFGIYKAKANKTEINRLLKLSIITMKENDLIDQYKHFLKEELNPDLRKNINYVYHVDRVLFATGKMLKQMK